MLRYRPTFNTQELFADQLPQGELDTTKHHDVSYLSACCLHQIYSLGSGNRSLYQSADRSRGALIGGLRGASILCARLQIEDDGSDHNQANRERSTSEQKEWLAWRDQEQAKRLAWSAFEYDCSLCTLTNRRGAVGMGELPDHLPCTEPLWEAPSAGAWRALLNQSSVYARGFPSATLMRRLMSGYPPPADMPPWGKRLCAQVIGCVLWDLKQMEVSWMSSNLGLSSLHFARLQTVSSVLQAFGSLSTSMSKATCISELISYK